MCLNNSWTNQFCLKSHHYFPLLPHTTLLKVKNSNSIIVYNYVNKWRLPSELHCEDRRVTWLGSETIECLCILYRYLHIELCMGYCSTRHWIVKDILSTKSSDYKLQIKQTCFPFTVLNVEWYTNCIHLCDGDRERTHIISNMSKAHKTQIFMCVHYCWLNYIIVELIELASPVAIGIDTWYKVLRTICTMCVSEHMVLVSDGGMCYSNR